MPATIVFAQKDNIPSVFKEEFTTVVRLYVNGNKSLFLKNIVDTSPNQKERERAQQELITHTNDRKLYFQNIKTAFESKYNQSSVLYIPDSLVTQLYAGVTDGLFFDDNGLISNEISLKTKSFIIIGRGSRDDDFSILDSKGRPFGSPVPSQVKLSFLTRLKSLFSDDLAAAVSHLNKTIGKLVDP